MILCGQSPGMAYGELGPTHHSIEDLSWLRAIAGLPVAVPADPAQTRAAVRWAAAAPGPSYVRVPRHKVPAVTPDGAPFEPGRAVQLTAGDDATVIVVGTMVSRALQAALELSQDGIDIRVLNMTFVDPLDEEAVLTAARDTGAIVTAEEATVSGAWAPPSRAWWRSTILCPCASSASAVSSPPRGTRTSCSGILVSPPTASSRRCGRCCGMPGPDPLVLAIDQGTSSTKVALVDGTGAIVSHGSAPLTQSHPRPGWVEQSGTEILDSVRAAVARCMAGTDRARVTGVGLSTQRESLLLWERRSGRPLGPMLSWQDQRTAGSCLALRADGVGELVRFVSGLPLDPMFSALKARWLLDEYDPDRTRSRAGELCLGTVDSWLLCRLTGEHLIEVGNASRTQLLDVRARVWETAPARALRRPGRGAPARGRLDRTVSRTQGRLAPCQRDTRRGGDGRFARRALRPRRLAAGVREGDLRNGLLDHEPGRAGGSGA